MSTAGHPTARPTVEDVDGFLAWRMVRTGRRVEGLLVGVIAELGLTPTEFGVLAHLATGEPFTASELARSVLVRPQSMGTLIGGLVEKGLVVRLGEGGRGRRTPIALTGRGAALAERAWRAVTDAARPERLGLDADDAAALDEALRACEHFLVP